MGQAGWAWPVVLHFAGTVPRASQGGKELGAVACGRRSSGGAAPKCTTREYIYIRYRSSLSHGLRPLPRHGRVCGSQSKVGFSAWSNLGAELVELSPALPVVSNLTSSTRPA